MAFCFHCTNRTDDDDYDDGAINSSLSVEQLQNDIERPTRNKQNPKKCCFFNHMQHTMSRRRTQTE